MNKNNKKQFKPVTPLNVTKQQLKTVCKLEDDDIKLFLWGRRELSVFLEDGTLDLHDGELLHKKLKVKTRYNDWVNRRVEQLTFLKEGLDYHYSNLSTVAGGTEKKVYQFSNEACKHIALMENNEIGFKVRSYFILAEKVARMLITKCPYREETKDMNKQIMGAVYNRVREGTSLTGTAYKAKADESYRKILGLINKLATGASSAEWKLFSSQPLRDLLNTDDMINFHRVESSVLDMLKVDSKLLKFSAICAHLEQQIVTAWKDKEPLTEKYKVEVKPEGELAA